MKNASSENVTSFTFVLASQASLTLRAITNGIEHMFRKSLEMYDTGNIFPISSLLKRKILIPTALGKMKKVKKFWSFVKSLEKDMFLITTLKENRILKT